MLYGKSDTLIFLYNSICSMGSHVTLFEQNCFEERGEQGKLQIEDKSLFNVPSYLAGIVNAILFI